MIDSALRAQWTRREFIRRLSALGGGLAAAPLFDALAQTPDAGKRLDVVIVGAGLAGLCAAYELEKRGHRVTIVEADARHVGGRTRTLRFGEGLYGEAGAMRIPARHEITRRYVAEFGLPLRKFVLSNPQAYYFLRGQRARIADVSKLSGLYAMRESERARSTDDLWADTVGKAAAALTEEDRRELTGTALTTARVRALDQQSLLQVIQSAGLSDEAIEFLSVTQGQETELWTGATETLREEFLEVWSQGFDEIVGGTDRLASAFAARLRSKPRMGCEVVRLTQDVTRRRAAAIYRQRGVEKRAEGDFVLCTLPFPVLSRLSAEPEFSGPKWRAVRELNYDSSTKVLFVCRRRFWEADDGIYGGGTYTDLPTGTTYYPSDNAEARDPRVSAGPGVMLASYSWGQAARHLASLPHPERAAVVLKHLSRVHPQLAEPGMLRQSASWSWDNHPYSGGAFAWFMPGQHTMLYPDVIAPEGRIHFAGEHASLAHTWMQGALESSLRAVQQMLAAS
ncbi:MAG: FAD-dependent oxidoreductase [Betaproteobacteria bacterium]